MNNRFMNLTDEKKQAILNAAVKEFAIHGYNKASTDVIAQQAKISKGSLFNYFNNKLGLYLHILKHCIEIINKATIEEMDNIIGDDFYDRLRQIALIKHKNVIKYPLEEQVITAFFMNPPSTLKEFPKEIEHYNEMRATLLQKYLIEFLDENKLREGVTKQDVIFMTFTLFEALIKRDVEIKGTSILLGEKEEETTLFDFDKYIQVLKHGVYKEK